MVRLKVVVPLYFLVAVQTFDCRTLTNEEIFFYNFRDFMFNLIGKTGTRNGLVKLAKAHKMQTRVGSSTQFPCDISNSRSTEIPIDVNRLRPGDIDIIAALGDSLTAGNGAAASNLFHVSQENRGISWSIGGQGSWREHLTLPNILKEFNPKLFGYSYADSYTHHRDSQFNVAEIGAMSRDMPFMSTILVKRIKADPRVNLTRDWKLVSLLIGPNDMCVDICYHSEQYIQNSAAAHKADIMKTLDYLRDNLPRTLVNLVHGPSMHIIKNFNRKPGLCEFTHLAECPCWFGTGMQHMRKKISKLQEEWQGVEEELALDPRYRRKDFAVVSQPFTTQLIFPQKQTPDGNVTDYTFLSEDCFHFSQKGYARASNALWNNMLEPVGQKSRDWTDTFSKFLCPTPEHPFIYTLENSPDAKNIVKRKVS